jgi:flagellar hook-basal body complex protein FliE
MAFSIPGVSLSAALPPLPPTPPSPSISPGSGTSASTGVGGAGTGMDFGSSLASAMDQLGALHQNSDALATKVATGELKNPHEYLMAAQEASISTQTAVAVRNKALEAFNEIMRMQL